MEDPRRTERILAVKGKHQEYQEMLRGMKRTFKNKACSLEKQLANRKLRETSRRTYRANAENFRSLADLLDKIAASHRSLLEVCSKREDFETLHRIFKELREGACLLLKKKELLEIWYKEAGKKISDFVEDSRNLPKHFL